MAKELIRRPNPIKLNDSLVAPLEKISVPNHILNTKIYARLQRNELFEVTPVEVHFSGFEVNDKEKKKYKQTLRIINISDQVQRMTILPPQTKYFDIHYTKPMRLVPGFSLDVLVTFMPEEYKYYNDSIRICSDDEENLYVPIHAYPILTTYEFPSKYEFPKLAIGQSLTKSIKLRSTAPIEYEYIIEILQKHPAFSIEPVEGIIPFNKDAMINVTFKPKEFCTAIMTIQLVISQFNSKPIFCTFYGTSKPGIDRDNFEKEALKKIKLNQNKNKDNFVDLSSWNDNEENDTVIFNNIDDAKSENSNSNGSYSSAAFSYRDSEKHRFNKNKTIGYVATPPALPSIVEGYTFPSNLNNTWSISKVLMQTKGKVALKDLKKATSNLNKLTPQAKENLFLKRVNDLENEERKNQLKWQVKLGEELIDAQTREEILIARSKAEHAYHVSIGIPFLEQEVLREQSTISFSRTFRNYQKLAKSDATFDMSKKQVWDIKYRIQERFIQTARTIIIRNRLSKVLIALKKFIDSWKTNIDSIESSDDVKLDLENYIEIYINKLNGQNLDENEFLKNITRKTFGSYNFPAISDSKEIHTQNARHCEKLSSVLHLDSLGLVAVRPNTFNYKLDKIYLNLSTPINYKLNSYGCRMSKYVLKDENLVKLRSGADDEYTKIDTDVASSFNLKEETQNKQNKLQKGFKEKDKPNQLFDKESKIIDLIPAERLSETPNYPSYHIFNPISNLVSFQKMLPYSGIDLNYHLNPLPRFDAENTFPTQKKFLDKEEIIKGTMNWKKFPVQSLVSLSNTPTLSEVWVPRLTNIFCNDVLSTETPQLLDGLPADDKENLLDDPITSARSNKEQKLVLSLDMVRAQFNIQELFDSKEKNSKEQLPFPYSDKLPATNLPVSALGQVSRNQREQELAYFQSKQLNTLGLKIQTKLIENQTESQLIASGNFKTNLSFSLNPASTTNNQPNSNLDLLNSSQTIQMSSNEQRPSTRESHTSNVQFDLEKN